MADLPYTGYCKVGGQLLLSVADTNLDPDKYPDGVLPSGTVTLTPFVNGVFIRFPAAKQGVVPRRIVLTLDSLAFLTSNGSREIYVPPTNDPAGNPQDWYWVVSFAVKDPEGNDLPIESYELQTPIGGDVDIFNGAPVSSEGGVLTIQGPAGNSDSAMAAVFADPQSASSQLLNNKQLAGVTDAGPVRTQVDARAAAKATPIASTAVATRQRRAPRLADGIFSSVDQALSDGRAAAIQVLSDSTGNSVGEWVYMLTKWVAARWPNAHVKYKVADQTPPYALPPSWETVQAGSDGERHAYFGPSGTVASRRSYYLTPDMIPSIVGDIDLRARLAPTKWAGAGGSQALGSRWGSGAGSKAWMFDMDNSGKVRFQWSADGTNTVDTLTATTAPGWADNTEHFVRATLDVDNGLGGYTATLYALDADGVTWTQLAQKQTTTGGATSLFNPGTTSSSQQYEIGGFGFTGYLLRGGKFFEFQIRDGIGGKIVNPQPIESWIPRNASSPYEAGEFRGGATLYVVNGAVSGADSQTILANATYFPLLLPPFPGSLVFNSCLHNENNLVESLFIASRDAWQNLIDARCPGNQTVYLTQNPKFAPSDSATIDSVQKHARRRQLLMSWAARRGVALIDTFRAFQEDGRPITAIVQADGVHPTQGEDVAGVRTGSGVWRDCVIDAWDASSPKV